MRIKNNISALNAHIALSINQSKLTKSLEKLASGYRINRAGDDAAGLAISEQMRAMISGMKQAELNAREGIGLIRTGEGALQEVNAMFVRLNELAMQSANGTYDDEEHRTLLQEEVDQICDEINRIAESTNYNGVNLFQDIGLEAEGDDAYATGSSLIKNTLPGQGEAAAMTLEDVLADKSDTLKNIIYTETVFDFETKPELVGKPTDYNNNDAKYRNIANQLQTSIVPQVVDAIVSRYTAFEYLNGSSIGIGLNLYSDNNSSVLASVGVSTSYKQVNGQNTTDFLTYTLSVNVAKVGDITNSEAARSSLEQTIAHEMIHAFMDEATTVGMIGIAPSGSTNDKFPSWFVEGMAQTASGPGNWIRSSTALGLGENATSEQIRDALNQHKLGTGSSDSEYGTGYLACMYLGYKASGGTADMDNPTAAAGMITQGLSTILSELIGGKSLNTVIREVTGGKFNSISAFESGFASDGEAQQFVQKLLKYTSDDVNGNVGGGLISGNLAKTDPVDDAALSGDKLKLFALNKDNQAVKNVYPSDITVLSGGGLSTSGVKPIPDPVDYPEHGQGIFEVNGGQEGTDWTFDTATGTLRILTDTEMTISGGTDAANAYYGNIEIADGKDAKLILKGVTIDVSKRSSGDLAGIKVGDGSTVNITVVGADNTIKGRNNSAGIQVGGVKDGKTSDLTINMQFGSMLNVTGGASGAGIGAAYETGTETLNSNIKITGEGTLNAYGGEGAAAIGGSRGGCIGDIEISGTTGKLTVKATAGEHGAGIGGGWFNAYPSITKNVGNIKISGNVDVDASSRYHGTGIGSGCCGEMGTLTIGSDAPGANNNGIKITATGGDDGAGIGAGWSGSVEEIIIHGGTINATSGTRGAGIGSGYQGESGKITINGGEITAKGSTNSSGIGSGMNGTVTGIDIKGGIISADGGWTNDGGNIGGYTDKSGAGKATVTIHNPGAVSIKAGEKGEGKYITTGAKDGNGNTLYALDMKYIDQLLKDGTKVSLTGTAPGRDDTSLSFPLKSITITGSSGTTSWNDLQHMQENSAYIWTKGEDITLEFEDKDGTKGSVHLKFYDDYGLWRYEDKDLPPELPKEPGYVATNPGGDTSRGGGSIILQVGAHGEDTFRIPRFYFSKNALKLDQFDVTTLEKANKSVTLAQEMTQRVSAIRGSYGAMDNALSHVINSLNVNVENQTAAESRIRDTDMAKELMEQTKNSILLQANQAMLSQANALPQSILELLR